MDKKDIYEHLAKIYLDASSKKKDKKKSYSKFFNSIYFVITSCIVCLSVIIFTFFLKNKPFRHEVALVLLTGPAKINFNFDPAKKEIFSLNLNNLNLKKFKSLGFAVKKKNYEDSILLRVEFINSFQEKSEIYLNNLPSRWGDYKINFSDFKNITDWSRMQSIAFIVEEWNVRKKEGVVYIDNVRLLR